MTHTQATALEIDKKSDEELKSIALTMIFILYGPRAVKVLGYEVPK